MFIRLETTSGVPLTRQIADQIRAQIDTGALSRGAKIPSVRALAVDLAVNQNTVLRVYERLTMEGLLEMRHGDGTYVAANGSDRRLRHQRELLEQEAMRLARRAAGLGLSAAQLQAMVNEAFGSAAKEVEKRA